jgi:WD40 repeat protein
MKDAEAAPGPGMRRYLQMWLTVLGTLALTFFAQTVAAEGPRGLHVGVPDVITLAEHPQADRVFDIAFSPKANSSVCALALEEAVGVWDLSAKPRVVATVTPVVRHDPFQRTGRGLARRPLAFSSDGARLATGYDAHGVLIWDVDQCKPLFAVPLAWHPTALRFSRKDSTLIVGSCYTGFYEFDSTPPGKIDILRRGEYERVPVQDPRSLKIPSYYDGPYRASTHPLERRNIYCLAVYPDGQRMVAGGEPVLINDLDDQTSAGSVTVWDLATGRQVFVIGDKESPILRFCLSPDGRVLHSCGSKVLGWDATKSGLPTRKFDASGRRMLSVAVSADGKMLAAGGSDGEVVIWDTESSARFASLTHSGGAVYCLAFSPTSTKLVAAGERGVATVWDIKLVPTTQN